MKTIKETAQEVLQIYLSDVLARTLAEMIADACKKELTNGESTNQTSRP